MKDEWRILASVAGLAVLYFVLHAIWNLIAILFYLVLLWLPPLVFSALLACLPPVVTWFVCRLYKRHGAKVLSSKSDDVKAVWAKNWLQLLPLAAVVVVLGLWALLMPRGTPWPTNRDIMTHVLAWGQNDASVQQLYVTHAPATFLYLIVPLIVGYFTLASLLRANVVRRFIHIDACIRGNDRHTTRLGSMDRQLGEAYGALGARRSENYADKFHSWVVASFRRIIKDKALLDARALTLKQRAANELAFVRKRVKKFQNVENLYRQGIKLLQTQTSVPLLESLEDAQRALTCPAFVQMVETKQWRRVDCFLKAAKKQLEQTLAFAGTWHAADADTQADAPNRTLTLEDALGLFGLSRDYTADEVGVLYKRLAKVYHPDFRPDQEAKQRNEEMLKRINAAEEILRKNLEGP